MLTCWVFCCLHYKNLLRCLCCFSRCHEHLISRVVCLGMWHPRLCLLLRILLDYVSPLWALSHKNELTWLVRCIFFTHALQPWTHPDNTQMFLSIYSIHLWFKPEATTCPTRTISCTMLQDLLTHLFRITRRVVQQLTETWHWLWQRSQPSISSLTWWVETIGFGTFWNTCLLSEKAKHPQGWKKKGFTESLVSPHPAAGQLLPEPLVQTYQSMHISNALQRYHTTLDSFMFLAVDSTCSMP